MIGLGSNRLTVCRRGGMSVTQAGRGGMEWLAGGRRPRWSSPYSAQATAALKAQFPTQWLTILDYGISHPEIVQYVNQYPIGWGNIIVGYQLCEYVRSTGTQRIETGISGAHTAEFDLWIDEWSATFSSKDCYAYGGFSNSKRIYMVVYQGAWNLGVGNDNLATFGPSLGQWYHVKVTFDNTGTSSVYIDGVLAKTVTSTTMSDSEVWLFMVKGLTQNPSKTRLRNIKITNVAGDTQLRQYYDCYNKESGVIGMYDVVNCEFKVNAGTGTFLKGSDIYYPGQSPS